MSDCDCLIERAVASAFRDYFKNKHKEKEVKP